MLGKTHKYVGGCCGILATETLLLQNNIDEKTLLYGGLLLSGSLLGSLILDIDKRGTKMGNKFPLLARITNFLFGHRGATHSPIICALVCLLLLYLNENTNNIFRLITVAIFSYILFYEIIRFIYKKVVKFRRYKTKTQITSFIITFLICSYFYIFNKESLNFGCFYLIIGIFIGMISHILLDFFNPMGVPLLLPISNRKFHILGVSESYGIVFSIIFSILVVINTLRIFGVV